MSILERMITLNKTKAKRAIRKIAASEGISVQEVREEMIKAMQLALQSTDPEVKAKWEQIPRKGESPTPEEFIVHMAKQVKQ